MATELRLPTEVSQLTQEQYDLYVKEVKAILYQLPQKQTLVTPESLASVENCEIVSIVQANGGILVQLRKLPSPLEVALQEYHDLSDEEKLQFQSVINGTP